MSVLERAFALDSGGISDLMNPQKWLLDWAAGSGVKSTAGEIVSPDTSMALSAYYDCIRVISEDVAKLPLKTYRRLERGKEIDTEHPNYRLLHDSPNPYMTSFAFREALTSWATGWGDGYAEIEWLTGNRVKALHPIHPSRVSITLNDDFTHSYFVSDNAGRKVYVPTQKIFHLHGLGPDGRQGYSVCRLGCESMGLGLAMQKFGAAFFGNGSSLAGVLEHPSHIRDPQRLEDLRRQWSELYQGAGRAGKTAILEDGMKYSKIGIPPEEAQFLESRQFQTAEICRWFRMPPHKIQDLTRSTYSNIEHQSIEYVTDTLMPWTVRWEQEIQRKLFLDDDEHFSEFVFTGLLRGDVASRGAFYRVMTECGGLSPNDIRELENMNPVEGGDQYFRPANLIPLDQPEPEPMPIMDQAEMEEPTDEEQEDESEPDEDSEENGSEDEGEDSEEIEAIINRPPDREPAAKPTIAVQGEPDIKGKAGSDFAAALYPIFEDAARRVCAKEFALGQKALTTHKGNQTKFDGWLQKFFSNHEHMVFETFVPAITAASMLTGKVSSGNSIVEHVGTIKNKLVNAFANGDGTAFGSEEDSMASNLAQAVMMENLQ